MAEAEDVVPEAEAEVNEWMKGKMIGFAVEGWKEVQRGGGKSWRICVI